MGITLNECLFDDFCDNDLSSSVSFFLNFNDFCMVGIMIGKIRSKLNQKARSSFGSSSVTLFGNNSFFQGKVILNEEARISGKVEGTIITEEALFIEEPAYVKGEIEGARVEISGEFHGNLKATEVLHLTETARVEGDLTIACLIVEEGAKLKGNVLYLEKENPVTVNNKNERIDAVSHEFTGSLN